MTPILERLHLTFKNFSFPQLLPFDFHATLASELSKSQFYTSCLMVDPHFRAKGLCRAYQICILPRVCVSDLRDLCRGLPVLKRNSHSTTCLGVRNARSPQTVAAGKEVSFHHTTCLPIRHARSPQRVAQGQTRPVFRHTFGCPTRRRG